MRRVCVCVCVCVCACVCVCMHDVCVCGNAARIEWIHHHVTVACSDCEKLPEGE